MTHDCPTGWMNWLSLALWWYNTSYHNFTRMMPFEAVNGYTLPIHIPYVPKDVVLPTVDQRLRSRSRDSSLEGALALVAKYKSRMKKLANS